jgi:hypothetical protein
MINRTYFARYRTGNNNGNYQEGSCLVTVKSLFPNPCKGFEKACENFKTKRGRDILPCDRRQRGESSPILTEATQWNASTN